MPWFCLTTPPSREIVAAGALEAAGYTALLPIEYRLKRRSLLTKVAVVYPVPVMPRYVVVDMGEAPNWPAVTHMEVGGVRVTGRPLGMGGAPYALPALAVSEVRNLMLDRLVVPLARGLVVGDAVVIESGPFAGHRAVVKRVRRNSARVALNLFGSLREIDVNRAYLSECGEKAAA